MNLRQTRNLQLLGKLRLLTVSHFYFALLKLHRVIIPLMLLGSLFYCITDKYKTVYFLK